jgi:DNA primase
MSKFVPDQVLEEIRFRNDIVEVIGSRLTLKRAGSSFKACCPFHKEKTPSFHVNSQRQSYHCFGCGEHGDVFKFIMQMDGLDFMSAVRILAKRVGVEVEVEDDDGAGRFRKALLKLHSEVAAKYHSTLKNGDKGAAAREYLKERGLTSDTVDDFLIGFAPDAWDAVLNWALKKGYTIDQLVESGLVTAKRTEGSETKHYDRFRNRLMFPIFDGQGRVVAFSGRVMDKQAKAAKYVNSPETPIFHKGRILYGMHKARSHIAKSREAIVCEGQIDVIRCHQAGFLSAVASQGTAFTEDHVTALKRFADSVVIAFDPDKAGQDAAVKTSRLFIAAGLAVRVVSLPEGEDPDSLIRKRGSEAFREIVDGAGSAVAYQVEIMSGRENMKAEVGTMRVARAVLGMINVAPSPVQKTTLMKEAATLLDIPVPALEEELSRMPKDRTRPRRTAQEQSSQSSRPASGTNAGARMDATPRPAARLNTVTVAERLLCEHAVHVADFPEIGDLVRKYLPLDMIQDPMCRATVQLALEAQQGQIPIEEIAADADSEELPVSEFVLNLHRQETKVPGEEFKREDAVRDLVLQLWRNKLTAERNLLNEDARERRAQLTYDLNSLRNWRDGRPIIEFELE